MNVPFKPILFYLNLKLNLLQNYINKAEATTGHLTVDFFVVRFRREKLYAV